MRLSRRKSSTVAAAMGVALVAACTSGGGEPQPVPALARVVDYATDPDAVESVVELADEVPGGDYRMYVAGAWSELEDRQATARTLEATPALTVVTDPASGMTLAAVTMPLAGLDPVPVQVDWRSTAFTMLVTQPQFVTSDDGAMLVLRYLAEQAPSLGTLADAVRDGKDTVGPLAELEREVMALAEDLIGSQGDQGPSPAGRSAGVRVPVLASLRGESISETQCDPAGETDRFGVCFRLDEVAPTRGSADVVVSNHTGSWVHVAASPGWPAVWIDPVTYGGITVSEIVKALGRTAWGAPVKGLCEAAEFFGAGCPDGIEEWADEEVRALLDLSWTDAAERTVTARPTGRGQPAFAQSLGRQPAFPEAASGMWDATTNDYLVVLEAWSYVVRPSWELVLGYKSATSPDQSGFVEALADLVHLPQVRALSEALDEGDEGAIAQAIADLAEAIFTDPGNLGKLISWATGATLDVTDMVADLIASGLTTAITKGFPVVGQLLGVADLVVRVVATLQQLGALAETARSVPQVFQAIGLWDLAANSDEVLGLLDQLATEVERGQDLLDRAERDSVTAGELDVLGDQVSKAETMLGDPADVPVAEIERRLAGLSAAADAAEQAPIWPLTVEDVLSAQIPSVCDMPPVTLTDGEATVGDGGGVRVREPYISIGELSGTERGVDAAFRIACGWGTGWPDYIGFMDQTRSVFQVLTLGAAPGVSLGNHDYIEKVEISGGVATATWRHAREGQPSGGDHSLRSTVVYSVQNGEVTARLDSTADLAGEAFEAAARLAQRAVMEGDEAAWHQVALPSVGPLAPLIEDPVSDFNCSIHTSQDGMCSYMVSSPNIVSGYIALLLTSELTDAADYVWHVTEISTSWQ